MLLTGRYEAWTRNGSGLFAFCHELSSGLDLHEVWKSVKQNTEPCLSSQPALSVCRMLHPGRSRSNIYLTALKSRVDLIIKLRPHLI